jgi:hypothetical protein
MWHTKGCILRPLCAGNARQRPGEGDNCKWLGALLGYGWAARQPALYEGVSRVLLAHRCPPNAQCPPLPSPAQLTGRCPTTPQGGGRAAPAGRTTTAFGNSVTWRGCGRSGGSSSRRHPPPKASRENAPPCPSSPSRRALVGRWRSACCWDSWHPPCWCGGLRVDRGRRLRRLSRGRRRHPGLTSQQLALALDDPDRTSQRQPRPAQPPGGRGCYGCVGCHARPR